MSYLEIFRWLGAGIAIVFGAVQGVTMAWQILPDSVRARLLRRASALAFAAHQQLWHLGNVLAVMANEAESRGDQMPQPEADPEPRTTRRKRSGV